MPKVACRRGITCTYPNCSFGHPPGYVPQTNSNSYYKKTNYQYTDNKQEQMNYDASLY